MRILISLLDGLLIVFVYGLSAMGLSLIWGVMKVINLSHGAVMALGMFFSYQLFSRFNPYLTLPAVAVFGLLLGLLIYGVAVHRVISAPHLSSLLATFAVNMIIIGVGTAIFSTSPRNIDYSAGTVVLGEIRLPASRLLAAAVSVVVTAFLYYFLYRTRSGKAIRAVANNRVAAGLMGISPTRSLALSFGIGTGLAALAGGLIASPTFRSPWMNLIFPADPISNLPVARLASAIAPVGHTSQQPAHPWHSSGKRKTFLSITAIALNWQIFPQFPHPTHFASSILGTETSTGISS